MAVLGRLLMSSAERLDLPDFLSIDSFSQGDFKFLMKSFVGSDRPYVLKGFDIINPGAAIGTQNVSIRVADSVVYSPESLAGPFFFGLEEGNTLSAPLVPELRKNNTNFIYLTLSTVDAAKDTRAFWDPDKEGGTGGEFTQDVNTQSALVATVNVSVSSFPEDSIPVAIVNVGANFITSIEDARDMMFRLGTGGLNPNPLATYNFRADPTSDFARKEPNTTMTNALDPNSFLGGDKNIQTLKEWMDVVMTRIKELGGTTFWYEDTSTFNIFSIFKDALATSIKSKGLWNHSDTNIGRLTWTEDIIVQSVSDNKDIIIRADNKDLLDNQTMYISQTRNAPINTGSVDVEWFNGLNYVNGTLGSFENLSKGDWVKKSDDSDWRYLRVEEFYAASNLAGGVTAPATALSIKLSENYSGISELKQGVYTKGVYLGSDVLVADRDAAALSTIGGDLYWLAMRSDTIMSISDITTTTLSIDITNHNGVTAEVTSAAHGLSDGQRITIAGTTNFDGTYAIEAEDANTFHIPITGGPFADELGESAFYATVTTQARSTVDGLQLESANHQFSTDQNIVLSDTTNYNGTFKVYPTGATTFTVPVAGAIANETAGSATAVAIHVRTAIGPAELDPGENKQIGEGGTENIMSFIGMDNDAQTSPSYGVAPDYNTIDGYVNYNSDISDNLTARASKLTAMMADKAQDKTIVMAPSGYNTVSNTLNGTARDITFNAAPSDTPRLDIILPSSDDNNDVTLTGAISLEQNQAAYIEIDRNNAQSLANLAAVTVAGITSVPLSENVLILAVRLGTDEVWLWDGFYVSGGITPVPNFLSSVVVQDRNTKLTEGGTWSWDLGTTTITYTADSYVQIPGLDDVRNTIQTGTIVLPNDGDTAHVEVTRSSGAANNLTVTVTAIASMTPTLDTFVVARRVGNEVVIGTSTEKLLDGQSMTLDQTSSDQTLSYIGATNTADSDPNYSSVTSITQGNDLTTAMGEMDVSVDNHRTFTGASDNTDVAPTYSSDIRGTAAEDLEARLGVLTDAMGDSQEDRSSYFRSDNPITWTGTELQFTTDLVLDLVNTKSGAVVSHTIALANSPIALADGESAYISINRTSSAAATVVLSGTTPIPAQTQADKDIFILARRVDVTGVGYMHIPLHKQVLEPGQTVRLGASGAGGGAGNSIVETIKNRLLDSFYEAATPVIFEQDKDTLVDGASTGEFSLVTQNFEFDVIGETLVTVQQLDADFLASGETLDQVEAMIFYDLDNMDTTPTVEVSRNGGIEYQTVAVSRVDNTELLQGEHIFTEEAAQQTLQSNDLTTDDAGSVLNATTAQRHSQIFTVASTQLVRELKFELDRASAGTIGKYKVSLVSDDSGSPGLLGTDVLAETNLIDITDLSIGVNSVTIDFPETVLVPGDYHLVISTDQEYKDNFSAAVDELRVRVESGGTPDSQIFNGTAYSASTDGQWVYEVNGIAYDLRLRVTASAATTNIEGTALLYDLTTSGIATGVVNREVKHFNAVADNFNEFTLTGFQPNTDLLQVHYVEAGQVFVYPAFQVDGQKIIFATDQFNNGGVEAPVTLVFDQTRGGAFDNSDANGLLLSGNHLGSTDGTIDKSAAGRGIFLQRPDGTLREIAIDDDDNIVIFSV